MAYLKLIRQAEVYAPQYLGKKDVLIAGSTIAAIDDHVEINTSVDVDIIESWGKYLVPGFVDTHVHITGGGGEGSYRTRTPEIMLSDIITTGITTLVGCLGTDGTTRTMSNLIAKAKALEEEGITTYVYTGSYEIPVRTVTGSIRDDIILIDKVLGVGEIAISDHRSSQPSVREVMKIVADAYVGGMLAGKAGIVNVHVGKGTSKLDILEKIISETDIPATQMLPTHLARTYELLMTAAQFARNGGLIDLTTGTPAYYQPDKVGTAADALHELLSKDVSIESISFSSDGQGSISKFDGNGKLQAVLVGQVNSLHREFRKAVLECGISLEDALKVVSSNPARNMKLNNKGKIKEGCDADILLLDEQLDIRLVMARGRIMVENGQTIAKGTFEIKQESA